MPSDKVNINLLDGIFISYKYHALRGKPPCTTLIFALYYIS